MNYSHLKLKVLDKQFKYVLLKDKASVVFMLERLTGNDAAALFISSEETSAIVPETLSVEATKTETDWSGFKIVGDMPFGTVQGLIATISAALKDEGLGICVVSTFLSDWFFVKSAKIDETIDCLKKKGWEFVS